MPYPSKTDRETILAAAVQQLEARGLRDLSMRSLASSLGLTPNALYRYFADRTALESALAGEVSQLLQSAMQRAVRKGGPEQTIRGIARAYLAFARTRPNLYELLLLPCDEGGEGAASHERLWNFVVENVGKLTGPRLATNASMALWAYLHGTAQLIATKGLAAASPGNAFEFGLNAWLAEASAGSSESRELGRDRRRRVRR